MKNIVKQLTSLVNQISKRPGKNVLPAMEGIIDTNLAAISGVIFSRSAMGGGAKALTNLVTQTDLPVMSMTKVLIFLLGNMFDISCCQPSRCFSKLNISLLSSFSWKKISAIRNPLMTFANRSGWSDTPDCLMIFTLNGSGGFSAGCTVTNKVMYVASLCGRSGSCPVEPLNCRLWASLSYLWAGDVLLVKLWSQLSYYSSSFHKSRLLKHTLVIFKFHGILSDDRCITTRCPEKL